MTRLFATALLALAAATAPLLAQAPPLRPFRADDERPIPRAVPVRPGEPVTPAATPLPIRRAVPVARPKATPAEPEPPVARPKATPPQTIEPADPGEIRMTPQAGAKSPDQAQLDAADSYYARKMYDMAATEYQRYTEQYPSAPDMQAALFRLGECYRKTGSTNAAKGAYDSLLARSQTGEFVGPAAFRLADIYYQEKNYTFALPFFRKAALRLKEPAVAMAAKFYIARSLEALGGTGNRLEASEIYQQVADAREANPFQEPSRLSLALLLRDANRTAEAVKQIKLLASSTQSPELKAEATVRAGVWELDLQQLTKAADDLHKALTMPGLGKWKEVALIGLMRLAYDSGKYKEVLDLYTENASNFSPDSKPELLLLAANSQRQLGQTAEALKLYDQLIKDFPLTTYGRDAAYQRLVTYYNSDDEKLIPAIDDYLTGTNDPDKRDQVMLMKAESLYKKQNYAAAAPIYGAVAQSRILPGVLRAEALFKSGWGSKQTRDFDKAISAFTELIDSHPTFKSLPLAIAERAIAFQSKKDFASAEKDYTTLIKKYPKAAKERELALQQKALIRGDLNDKAGMVENFELLLKDYPETLAAPEAYFWIGRSAYDLKDYKKAAEKLSVARKLDPKSYFERASLPLILSYYYLNDKVAVAREVDLYLKEGKGMVPEEVLRWLGDKFNDPEGLPLAEKYLAQLTARETAKPSDFLKLGQAQLRLEKFDDSAKTLQTYLKSVKEPPSRALGLLDLAKAEIGGKDFAAAQKSVDEALTLQPEGKLSGEGRILAGDIQAAQGNWETAAKLYMTVALTLDDEDVTPRALEKAVSAYQRAGKDPEAKKTLNTLQSRYPEYSQRKKVGLAKP
jgi:TolA-binding protein